MYYPPILLVCSLVSLKFCVNVYAVLSLYIIQINHNLYHTYLHHSVHLYLYRVIYLLLVVCLQPNTTVFTISLWIVFNTNFLNNTNISSCIYNTLLLTQPVCDCVHVLYGIVILYTLLYYCKEIVRSVIGSNLMDFYIIYYYCRY